MEPNKKKFSFLYPFKRDGKGVEKEEAGPPNLKNFFKLFGRKFTRLLSLNLYMLVGAVPPVLMAYLFFTGEKTPSVTEPIYPALWGASQVVQTPALQPLFGTSMIQFQLPFLSLGFILMMVALALVWFFIFGYLNVGTTFVLRAMVRSEPVFMWSDFWYAIRRNRRQGLLVGALDLLILGLLVFDLVYFYSMIGSFAYDMMFFLIIALLFLYNFMRFYLYLMLVTFDLPIRKLIKNAFIFAIVGIKRNMMALLGIIAMLAINYILITLLGPLGLIVVVILPVIYFPACAAFMAAYAAWAKIDELMIKPYQTEDDDSDMMPDADAEALL
ncbi:MAG: hypothetical protein IKD37_08770 [Clostridia bacterium]|nr:hypothetical protein [Clostridia bacterium]